MIYLDPDNTPKVRAALNSIKGAFGAATDAEAVEIALGLADRAAEAKRKGENLLVHKGGDYKELIVGPNRG